MIKRLVIGDKVKFDHMGVEHSGVVLDITASNGGAFSHDVVHVKSNKHVSSVVINATLFPGRIRKDEDRGLSDDSTGHP